MFDFTPNGVIQYNYKKFGGVQMKSYIYNIKTHTLHIEGFCRHTFEGMHYGETYKVFKTEDEAIAFDGRAVSMCKLCQAKRDKKILNSTEEKI